MADPHLTTRTNALGKRTKAGAASHPIPQTSAAERQTQIAAQGIDDDRAKFIP